MILERLLWLKALCRVTGEDTAVNKTYKPQPHAAFCWLTGAGSRSGDCAHVQVGFTSGARVWQMQSKGVDGIRNRSQLKSHTEASPNAFPGEWAKGRSKGACNVTVWRRGLPGQSSDTEPWLTSSVMYRGHVTGAASEGVRNGQLGKYNSSGFSHGTALESEWEQRA